MRWNRGFKALSEESDNPVLCALNIDSRVLQSAGLGESVGPPSSQSWTRVPENFSKKKQLFRQVRLRNKIIFINSVLLLVMSNVNYLK
jgi:hypothetical protein